MDDEDNYRYRRLKQPDQIRILVLRPSSDFDSVIQCDMWTSSLKEPFDFEALSYTRGSKVLSRSIACNESLLPVTENLYVALRRLRHHSNPRPLWIDAVCINQNDVEEWNQQITLIPRIYSNATQTVVWLGEDTQFRDGEISMRYLSAPQFHVTSTGVGPDNDTIVALTSFFSRPWFTRRWILQAVCYSEDLVMVCGPHQMVPRDFTTVVQSLPLGAHEKRSLEGVLQLMVGLSERAPFETQDSEHRLQAVQAIWRMLQDLQTFDRMECTDDRDRIYALLNLNRGLGLTVEYSLPLSRVYIDFALLVLAQLGIRYLLWQASFLRHRRQLSEVVSLPTWVPDWRIYVEHDATISFNRFHDIHPDGSSECMGSCGSEISWNPDQPNQLVLSGKLLGVVTSVFSAVPNHGKDSLEGRETLCNFTTNTLWRGSCDSGVEDGDQIFMFGESWAVDVAVALRPVGDHLETFRTIGVCVLESFRDHIYGQLQIAQIRLV